MPVNHRPTPKVLGLLRSYRPDFGFNFLASTRIPHYSAQAMVFAEQVSLALFDHSVGG
jgi:hypothetical protein